MRGSCEYDHTVINEAPTYETQGIPIPPPILPRPKGSIIVSFFIKLSRKFSDFQQAKERARGTRSPLTLGVEPQTA